MKETKDLTGQKFGMLTVIEEAKERKDRKIAWVCKCDCGNMHVTTGTKLTNGYTHSCGCLRYKKASETLTKHGKRHTRIYRIWADMRSRCYYESHIDYSSYGGRGIEVCPEWREDFQAFHDWAMANGYRDDLSIDRIEVNGNYEPSNCRWSTSKEQSRNTRRNRIIEFNGEKHCVVEWSEITGIDKSLIVQRLDKLGWSVEKTLTEPVRKYEHLLTYKGKTQSMKKWADEIGINASTLRNRIDTKGWTVEKALTEPVRKVGKRHE